MFINILKLRLQFLVPDKCGDLVRNEAHVRMMSSVWYSAQALRRITEIAWVLMILGVIAATQSHLRRSEFFGLVLASCGLYYAAFKAQREIENFFHYQRVREVVYVLETAYFAEKQGLHIFDPVPGSSDLDLTVITGGTGDGKGQEGISKGPEV